MRRRPRQPEPHNVHQRTDPSAQRRIRHEPAAHTVREIFRSGFQRDRENIQAGAERRHRLSLRPLLQILAAQRRAHHRHDENGREPQGRHHWRRRLRLSDRSVRGRNLEHRAAGRKHVRHA